MSSSSNTIPVANAQAAGPTFDPMNPRTWSPEQIAQAQKMATETAPGMLNSAMKSASNMKTNASDTLFRWTGGRLGTKKAEPMNMYLVGGAALVFIALLAWYFSTTAKKKTGAPGDEEKEENPPFLRSIVQGYWGHIKNLNEYLNKLTNGNLSLILVTAMVLTLAIYYKFYYTGSPELRRNPSRAAASYKSYYAPRQCRYKMK